MNDSRRFLANAKCMDVIGDTAYFEVDEKIAGQHRIQISQNHLCCWDHKPKIGARGKIYYVRTSSYGLWRFEHLAPTDQTGEE